MMQRWTALVLAVVGLAVVSLVIARSRTGAGDLADEVHDVPSAEQARAGGANAHGRTPVVVELFTSEGCSSCPPADDLLRRLDETQPLAGAEVIALEQHVDYWNRLGWADPFSAPEFSARQGDYADYFDASGVYTPQMIVDGQAEFPGSNQSKARAAIDVAAQRLKATITLARAGAAQADAVPLDVRVDKLPVLDADDTAEVLLAITETGLRTDVSRGENAGRTLAHAAIVRSLSSLGTIDTRASGAPFAAHPAVALGAQWKREHLRAVVFIQEHNSRRILGAATLKLSE